LFIIIDDDITFFSILQFKKWFVFLEQWFFANKDSHVCCFVFLTLYLQKKKMLGWGSFSIRLLF